MATPAASAWHRSRDLSQRLSVSTRASQPTTTGRSFVPATPSISHQASIPPSSHIQPNAHQNLGSGNHPSSVFRKPNVSASPSISLSLSKLSLSSIIRCVVSPFLSLSHTSLLQICVATFVTLLIFHTTRIVFLSTVGTFLHSCSTNIPRLSSAISFLCFVLMFPLIATLLASHSLMSTAVDASPPSRTFYFVIALIATPLQAIAFAYLLYGPSLSPHQLFCSTPSSFFPSRSEIQVPLITALCYPFVLYAIVFHLRFHTSLSHPFPRSTLRCMLSCIPNGLILAVLPTLPLTPITFLAAFLTRPERPFYTTVLITFSRTLAALSVTAAAMLPHTLVHFYEVGRTSPCTDTIDGLESSISFGGIEAMRTALSTAQRPAVREAFVEMARMPERMMQAFPPFTDPTSRLWRSTLDSVLAPLLEIATDLRTISPRATQGTLFLQDQGIGSGSGGGGGVGLPALRSTTVIPELREVSLHEAIPLTQVLANVFEASVKYDSYGVVLPTLAHTLALLVLLHDGLCSTLQYDGHQDISGRVDGIGQNLKGSMMWMLEAVDRRSQTRALAALKDAVSICVYRIVYSFRDQVVRFVEGREVGWDPQANTALRPFLEFSA